MSTYLSDIDLATLHKKRLDEKNLYKLSWYNRHDEFHHQPHLQHQTQTTIIEHKVKSKMEKVPKSRVNESQKPTVIRHQSTRATNDVNNAYRMSNGGTNIAIVSSSHHVLSGKRSPDYYDEGYLSEPTLSRRRSGTWPVFSCVSATMTDNFMSDLFKFRIHSRNRMEENAEFYQNEGHLSPYSPYSSSLSIEASSSCLMERIPRLRTRSLNAPSPFQQFGPCGRIMKNSAMVMQIQDPASQRLTWYKPPLAVLVIKKVRDSTVLSPFVQLVEWLIEEKHMVVWVESAVLDDPLLMEDKKFQNVKDKLVTFKDGRDDLTDRIDFIICLGGDGTLLYASLLFQQSVPPVMAFHLGSLGFLTPFQFHNFQGQVTNVLEGHAALTLRSRLRCIIVRKNPFERKDSNTHNGRIEVNNSGNSSNLPSTNILVLNEVVIDRGPSPYLSNIDLFLDGKHITSVQGDGLIVSTPTGSTAYAVAAGASMIHPSVPAIMVTPICPHSLSFRPIVVPAGVELKISISPDSRNTSWVSFDGRNRQELFHGDSLRVTTSIYPVPSICAQDQISDWFDSLAECLHWNVRKRQKCLDELSDLTGSGSEDTFDDLERGMENLEC